VSPSSHTSSPWSLRAAAPAIVPAAIVALWPKCPLCLTAYGGVLGALGLGAALDSTAAKVVLLALVATGRLGSMRRTRAVNGVALLVGVAALAMLAVSLLAYRSALVAGAGVGLLAASFVMDRPRRPAPACPCARS